MSLAQPPDDVMLLAHAPVVVEDAADVSWRVVVRERQDAASSVVVAMLSEDRVAAFVFVARESRRFEETTRHVEIRKRSTTG